MAQQAGPLQEWYFDVPAGTRSYLTAVFVTTLACQLELVSPFHLYFNWDLIWRGGQWWRLLTSFLYFGNFSVDFVFHMFFLVRYSRALEEGSFRGKTGDFVWMLLLAAVAIIVIVPLLPQSSHLPFLSSPLTFHLVYLWSRRNPHVRMNFLGLFNFTAPYLPYVLVGFSLLLNNVWPTGDLVGIVVGHVYYYATDVWPRVGGVAGVLDAPLWFKRLLELVFGIRDDSADDAYLPPGIGAAEAPRVPAPAPAPDGDGEGSQNRPAVGDTEPEFSSGSAASAQHDRDVGDRPSDDVGGGAAGGLA